MSTFVQFIVTPEFLVGVSVPLVLGGLAFLSTRSSDTRKMKHEDLKSNRQLIRETATGFAEVCTSILEKAQDHRALFNVITDFVKDMDEMPDTKAMDKLEFSIELMSETKRLTTAFSQLRLVAPSDVIDKAVALNTAMIAICEATTLPLAKPPLFVQAGIAMEDFTNAVRAACGLDPYTTEDGDRAGETYMEALNKQMQDYIKETQEDAKRLGILAPGSLSLTPIRAADLTSEHVGQFIGCNDRESGFNYGAKIVNIARQDYGPRPGILIRLQHPPLPSGKPGRQDRTVLAPEQVVQLVEMPGSEAA